MKDSVIASEIKKVLDFYSNSAVQLNEALSKYEGYLLSTLDTFFPKIQGQNKFKLSSNFSQIKDMSSAFWKEDITTLLSKVELILPEFTESKEKILVFFEKIGQYFEENHKESLKTDLTGSTTKVNKLEKITLLPDCYYLGYVKRIEVTEGKLKKEISSKEGLGFFKDRKKQIFAGYFKDNYYSQGILLNNEIEQLFIGNFKFNGATKSFQFEGSIFKLTNDNKSLYIGKVGNLSKCNELQTGINIHYKDVKSITYYIKSSIANGVENQIFKHDCTNRSATLVASEKANKLTLELGKSLYCSYKEGTEEKCFCLFTLTKESAFYQGPASKELLSEGEGLLIGMIKSSESSVETKYQGEFKNGMKHGKGIVLQNSKKIYEGEFKEDHLIKGTYFNSKDVKVFEGQYVNSLPNEGILYYSNGDRFEGTVDKNYNRLKGNYYYEAGSTLFGIEYINLKKEGKAKEIDKNKGEHQLEFKNDVIIDVMEIKAPQPSETNITENDKLKAQSKPATGVTSKEAEKSSTSTIKDSQASLAPNDKKPTEQKPSTQQTTNNPPIAQTSGSTVSAPSGNNQPKTSNPPPTVSNTTQKGTLAK